MPGEVDACSILDNKTITKQYWEHRMMASATPALLLPPAPTPAPSEEGGWEPVANVCFRDPNAPGNNRRGDANRLPTVKGTLTAAQIRENVIEAEIRAQQERERELQLEQIKKNQVLQHNMQNEHKNDIMRKKGASSPHDSDEGFVDPPVEGSASKVAGAGDGRSSNGFTHTVTGSDGESVIYDAVTPVAARSTPVPAARVNTLPSGKSASTNASSSATTTASIPAAASATNATTPAGAAGGVHTTETKIALEIRELKEREEELRRMRDARLASKKLQNGGSSTNGGFTSMNGGGGEDVEEEFAEEDIEDVEGGSSGSSREMLDDHLASLTTTTDEGNFSECGDATSSEDKSSNGSNSRIMSPEVPPSEYARPSRRVTVRPYRGDDDEEQQPIYTRMKNESVIDREIRTARERDEAFKREKGIVTSNNAKNTNGVINSNGLTNSSSNGLTNGAVTNGINKHTPLRQSSSMSAITQNGAPRDPLHHLATNRIQLEIAENGQRERECELMSSGKILTLSEDTGDDKVTRISDLAEMPSVVQERTKSPTSIASRSSSGGGGGSSRQSPSMSPQSTLSSSGRHSHNGGSVVSGLTSAFGGSNGQLGGVTTINRLTRSLSTTNLSSPHSSLNGGGSVGIGGASTGGRPPKGLMEKFIASRGKMTPSAFSTQPLLGGSNGRVVVTRPMRVQPKAPVVLRQQFEDDDTTSTATNTNGKASVSELKAELKTELKSEVRAAATPPQQPLAYKRVIGAEEKIQEELRDMQQREEELRQLRSRSMARSHPNLLEMGLSEINFEDEHNTTLDDASDAGASGSGDGDDGEAVLRAAISNPNLLEDGVDIKALKTLRRRSTLIAEWENRIQATTVADA